jgi:hypothetical protein
MEQEVLANQEQEEAEEDVTLTTLQLLEDLEK